VGKVGKILRFYLAQNILFLFRKAINKDCIIKDIRRWQNLIRHLPQNGSATQVLVSLFRQYPEFRNLFYFRLRKDPVKKHLIYSLTHRHFFPPKLDLVINANEDIGPGLFIQHGRSSGMLVQRMGANCWINQHVSIGYRSADEQPPTIGDNVRITAGAKIYGQITIGDNVTVGANAVVVKDVPPNCTVIGVPARIIRRNGKRTDEPL
jgi:serine O-acetyltransferase